MSRPRLLYLVTEDWYFVSHRLALAKAAQAAGYDVSVVTRVARHGDMIRDAGFELVAMPFDRSGLDPIKETKTLAALIQIYRRIRPDVVHHVAMKPVLYGSVAARATGVPRVINALMGLGYVFTSDNRRARILKPAVRAALKAALTGKSTHVIVQNEDDRTLFSAEGLVRPQQLHLIRGSGVDLAAYPETPPPKGRPRIVLPARVLRDKGVVEFVEAARILKASGVDAEFVLAGAPDPVNPASLSEREIVAWVDEGLITYLGWRDDMAAVIASATIVCLPSYREGLPKALLEAAAMARPIVATDVPGCREIVRDGENGVLVPARDSAAMAGALQRLIDDPDLCRRLGTTGRRMVEDAFSLDHVIAQTLAVYRQQTGSR